MTQLLCTFSVEYLLHFISFLKLILPQVSFLKVEKSVDTQV